MRKTILTAISILAMVVIVSLNTAAAEEKRIVIEMGESGQTVSFPMTSEEIAAADADKSKLVQGGALNPQKTAPRFKTIEMGETGQIVSFLMTPEEIATEDDEKSRFAGNRKLSSDYGRLITVFEMAESGMLIEFPQRDVEVNSVRIAKIKNTK